MFTTLKNAFKVKEIRNKIFMTLLFILIYRIGCYIPVPGIGMGLFKEHLEKVSYLNIMSMMSGGALEQGTWLAMGIGPYINASIIIQLLSVAFPRLERLAKQGEEGQKKIAKITRYTSVLIAIIQSIGILVSFNQYIMTSQNATALVTMLFNQKWLAYIMIVMFYAAGSLITVWIGERITEYGVSNGISLLIFVGIIATASNYFVNTIRAFITSGFDLNEFWKLVMFIVAIVVIFTAIVWVELAERKVPVQYAKQVRGGKMYGGQSTVIPIKVNANGVMPLIFAYSLLSFPELIITMFWPTSGFAIWWQTYMGSQSWLFMVILTLLIFGFAFFYAQIQFNPEDISKSIQQNGGYILGIRPGRPTADYLRRIQHKITLFGAIFLSLVAIIPAIVFRIIDPASQAMFTATGLLICVSVALEFNTALESQIMMKNYKGFLK